MLSERTLWLGATTVAIGILLVMILQLGLKRRDATTPRVDESAATWQTFERCDQAGLGRGAWRVALR